MNDNTPHLPNDPREAAAYWFARVHSGRFTLAEKQQFGQWREADSRHEHEYRAIDEIWQAASLIAEDELRELLEAPQSHGGSRPRLSRRQWIAGGAAACAAALVAGVGLPRALTGSPSFEAEYATVAGEQRSETLPDGSVLELNTRSRIVVRYYDDQRRVELLEGEVMFSVAHNARQPFLVDAGPASVRVTGTQFNVRRDAAQVDVAVQSGSVEVTSGQWWNRHTATLTASQRTHVQPGELAAVEDTDIAALTAWRQGKVVFKEQPLERVIHEMNRYLASPIRLADSRLKGLSMTGVFNIRDADSFLQALRTTLPVAVRLRADGGADLALLR
ncbi:FecR family protein [Pollutimonas bauzanensis]|uniref:FecR family protein n=1 Tax=Pollutimonas bauzanensis TaxID=658167 RepID=A0A1M5Z6J1_9BURK|nr:FecR family protein [Pollutimonas bauzanensis]SHI19862.1 FecR family protein [Pollutimonas bauzanensis]